MKAIYEPKGKALEYGKLACNLYAGCGHGCTYCYVPNNHYLMSTYGFNNRQEFYDNPRPREGIIEALKKDAKRIGDKYKKAMALYKEDYVEHKSYPERPVVFLCFTCDPYQRINEEHQLTRQAIEILHANEIAVNILTKGVITDFDLLAKRPDLSKVGVTLTFAKEMEPSRPITEMIEENLASSKEYGIKNWVSYEPIIYPNDVLKSIECLDGFVDMFKLGKWNYDPRAKDIDWYKFTNDAIELLEKLNCKYYIKEDLRGCVR